MLQFPKQLQYTFCPIPQEVNTINQTLKLGQLKEDNMETIFLEK